MVTILATEQVPIKLWLDTLDGEALVQAKNLANLPFVHSHVAIMPDAHMGYGMPIGGIMAADGVVVPNAVGVDIGCGMCAVQTSLRHIDTGRLKKILGLIRKSVPVGFMHHRKKQREEFMPGPPDSVSLDELTVVRREYDSARTQVGTLGGGNHFIEIQRGDDGYIWLMIHSGSRNLGLKVATFYNRLAVELNGRLGPEIPKKWQLAYLPADSDEGRAYLREMNYCVDFALANRKLMMDRVLALLDQVAGPFALERFINIAHNYARLEEHFGKNVYVHRKGATSAQRGEEGIIPGSQGAPSYIVRGLGNPDSFCSCSHGAGRRLGRKQAQRSLDLKKERRALERQGILHAIRGKRDLDEAPGAYKDIDRVIAAQQDLVEVKVRLRPLAVVKG
jgi:tRNA-splicing ligase RtcB